MCSPGQSCREICSWMSTFSFSESQPVSCSPLVPFRCPNFWATGPQLSDHMLWPSAGRGGVPQVARRGGSISDVANWRSRRPLPLLALMQWLSLKPRLVLHSELISVEALRRPERERVAKERRRKNIGDRIVFAHMTRPWARGPGGSSPGKCLRGLARGRVCRSRAARSRVSDPRTRPWARWLWLL